ncbi:MAG: hypothetical protein K0Q50_1311 [Vampirovibrio sp.]|jgi:hypothetical protein|nr:hypothetical protein [Vampirovibrio sp.]
MLKSLLCTHKTIWLALLAVSTWIFLYLMLNNITDWDLWGVMSFGALLDQNPGWFPYTDPFSYTAFGKPWIYHEWGSGVIFYQVFKHGGSTALFWLKLLLVEAIFLVACLPMIRQKQNFTRLQEIFIVAGLPLGAYLILPIVSTTIRCHLFTFLGYAITLQLLERHRKTPTSRMLWLLPLFMVLWVNVHGGFITGIVAIGVYAAHAWVSRQTGMARHLSIIFLFCGVSTLMNPYGLAFITTMFSAWTLPRTGISEWGNVFSLDIPAYGLIYTLLLVGGLGLIWYAKRRNAWHALLLIAFTGIYGWLHYKLAPLFLITLLSLGYALLPSQASDNPTLLPAASAVKKWGIRCCNLLIMALPIVLILIGGIGNGIYLYQTPHPFAVKVQGTDTVRSSQSGTRFAYPIGAVNFLKQNRVEGNVWVPFTWGEFIYWVLTPQGRVSMDGRYETVYPLSVYKDYRAFYHPPYDISRAERYPTTHILVQASQSDLLRKLSQSGRWHVIYQDSRTVLFAKKAQPPTKATYPEQSALLDDYRGNLSRFKLNF